MAISAAKKKAVPPGVLQLADAFKSRTPLRLAFGAGAEPAGSSDDPGHGLSRLAEQTRSGG